MQYIYLGKLVNTHGIKGEVRILSNFKYKEAIFKRGNFLYIGKNHEKKEINSYRKHKDFDMVCFSGITDINQVLTYKGEPVYFNRDEVSLPGILNEDLIDLSVYDKDVYIGKVTSILQGREYDILEIKGEKYTSLVPNIEVFVKKIDINNRRIDIESIEGLLYEN